MQYVCMYIHITYILHITCLRCYSFLVICYYGLCKLYIGFKQIHVIQCGFISAPCLLYVVSGRCHGGSMWLGTHPLSEHVARYSSVFSLWLGVQSLFHQVTRSLSLLSPLSRCVHAKKQIRIGATLMSGSNETLATTHWIKAPAQEHHVDIY